MLQGSKSSRHKHPLVLSSPVRSKGKDNIPLRREDSESFWESTDLSHSSSRPIPVPMHMHKRSKSFFDAKVSPSYNNTPDMVPDLDQPPVNMVRIFLESDSVS